MTLTPQNIADIRRSWQEVAADAEAVAVEFYETLFRRDPALRALFAGIDMPAQRQKLLAALALVVRSADDLGPLLGPLEAMGARHHGYGVQDKDYDTVGAALIATMQARLGPRFTAETRDAWIAAYGVVAGAMQAGAASVRRRSA